MLLASSDPGRIVGLTCLTRPLAGCGGLYGIATGDSYPGASGRDPFGPHVGVLYLVASVVPDGSHLSEYVVDWVWLPRGDP
jgi:hypothetical protein